MSLLKTALEAQEQDLEYQAALDDSVDSDDNIADSPFSPIASRAFATAVDDSETLAEMNDVLENSDIEDIPESSRRVIQTAMESIRSRLLGGNSVKGVAIEGFANSNDLKVAIEDNKNILQRAWDAIVKFFKGIYDWITSFFRKKENDVAAINKQLEQTMEAITDMISKEIATSDLKSVELAKVPSLHGVGVKLQDGTVVGKSNTATEDAGVDYNGLSISVKGIVTGQTPVILVTDRYNSLFGAESTKVAKGWIKEFDRLTAASKSALENLGNAHIDHLASMPLSKEVLNQIPDATLEHLIGKKLFPLTDGTSISFEGNNVSVAKTPNSEIDLEVYGGLDDAKNTATFLKSLIKGMQGNNKKLFELTAGITNKVYEHGKKVDSESEESAEVAKIMKSKLQLINSIVKFVILVMNQSLSLTKVSIDFLESYTAAIALVVNQAKKAQTK